MRVIICGAGQVGSTIARHLAAEQIDVTAVDIDPGPAQRLDESYDVRGLIGHGSHPETLERAGARGADMLIAVTRSDEINIVACQVAHSLFNVPLRIARIRHHGYLAPMRAGRSADAQPSISHIISPEIEVARGIARRLREPGAFDMLPLAGGRMQMIGLHSAPSPLLDAPLARLQEFFPELSIRVIALVRQGAAFVPGDADRIESGDDIYLVTATDQVARVMAAFGHLEKVARRVVIVGGGNVGLSLAQIMTRETPQVSLKIVENSKPRSELISREIGDGAVVLHGDALDREVLEEANAGAAETVVAVTNDDETNIFASVLAKRAGCGRVITLVNKNAYEPLLPSLGIDAVVSPSAITISTILRYVRRGPIATLYALREDFGDLVEAEALPGSRLTQVPVGQLGHGDGLLVAAILRGEQVIIPLRSTQIDAGDRVIILVTRPAVPQMERLVAAPA
jgi:trk system potassium uptake protein TrkA